MMSRDLIFLGPTDYFMDDLTGLHWYGAFGDNQLIAIHRLLMAWAVILTYTVHLRFPCPSAGVPNGDKNDQGVFNAFFQIIGERKAVSFTFLDTIFHTVCKIVFFPCLSCLNLLIVIHAGHPEAEFRKQAPVTILQNPPR